MLIIVVVCFFFSLSGRINRGNRELGKLPVLCNVYTSYTCIIILNGIVHCLLCTLYVLYIHLSAVWFIVVRVCSVWGFVFKQETFVLNGPEVLRGRADSRNYLRPFSSAGTIRCVLLRALVPPPLPDQC